jgi:hypothetical protein
VLGPPVAAEYSYELRRGDRVVATGRLLLEDEPEVGASLNIAGTAADVREVRWDGSDGRRRLILDQRAQ